MITSMDRNELYKTLVGHSKSSHYTYFPAANNDRSVKKTTENKEISENVKNAMMENIKEKPIYKDLSDEPNMDRFVHYDDLIKQNYDIAAPFRNVELKEIPYEASDAIDFMGNSIQSELGKGFINGLPSKERIAEFYGAMAKRLDAAYAEGKFTKDEFDELNEMIEKQVEREAYLTENKTAFYALGRKRYSLSPEVVAEIVKMEKNLTPMERLAEREQEIRDYAEKYCKIDRITLMKLFNNVRYGK